jgi:hypothetical protein
MKIIRLLTIILLVGVFLTPHVNGQAQTTGTNFPVFTNQTRILPNPIYDPTGEQIFPSIIRAADHFSSPLGTYYLYYAPHDSPGGISLAYANSLDGPWTEYSNNPIISNNWSPHYNVSHVSSPDAIWIPETSRLHLYFHGENTTSRIAWSTNGINFTYDKIAVNTMSFNNVSEASYMRVFRHTIAGRNNTYTAFIMGNNAGTRRIYLAWSNDGRFWSTQRDPFISPNAEEGTQLSGATLFLWQNKIYAVYHSSSGLGDDSGDMYASELSADFNTVTHVGMFYNSQTTSPDDSKASSPDFITVGNTLYMFYGTGPRLESKLASAKSNLSAPPAWETILDNTSNRVSITGTWITSTGAAGYYGANYLHDDNTGKGSKRVTYTPDLPTTGTYVVYGRWSAHPNRATNVPIVINHAGGATTVTLNQQTNGGTWVSLGTYTLKGGTVNSIVIRNDATNGYVTADAVRFVKSN